MGLINGYLKKNQVNFDLGIRIQNYLEYIWQGEQLMNSSEEKRIVNKLSQDLREELLLAANGKLIQNLPVFGKNFSEQFLRRLAFIIEEVHVPPDEHIYKQEDLKDCSIYLLISGEIELFLENSGNLANKGIKKTVLQKLSRGQPFGTLSFFTGLVRKEYAKSVDYSRLLRITREEFLMVAQEFPADFEKFNEIRHQILFGKRFDNIYLNCKSCQLTNHLTHECPLFHHIPNQKYIIEKYLYSIPHLSRNSNFKNRRISREPNSLFCFKKNAGIVKVVQMKMDNFDYDRNASLIEEDTLDDGDEEDEEEDNGYSDNQIDISIDSNRNLHVKSKLIRTPTMRGNKKGSSKSYRRRDTIKSMLIGKSVRNIEFKEDTNIRKSNVSYKNLNGNIRDYQRNGNFSKKNSNCELENNVLKILNKKKSYPELFLRSNSFNSNNRSFEKKIINSEKNNDKNLGKSLTEINFETVKSYSNYFMDFNIEEIIKKINKHNQMKVYKKKRLKK